MTLDGNSSCLIDAFFPVVSTWSNKSSGAHTDYGEKPAGEWISAPPIPGAFVCNICDMLKKIYTNGLYESTLHQVINNSPQFRTSVAYFYETNFNTAVEPLDICQWLTDGAKKFMRAVYGVSKVVTNFTY